jgi:phosphoglycolate phosphatase
MTPIKAILFDKDGTLVDFQATWHAIGDLMALKAAAGDRTLADAMMDTAGYDSSAGRFRADSVFAAGTNADIVGLWYPDLTEGERLRMVENFDSVTAAEGAAQAVPLPGVLDALGKLYDAGIAARRRDERFDRRRGKDCSGAGRGAIFTAVYGYDAVANSKPQDLADIGLRQVGAELDVPRPLVAGQVLPMQ